MPTTTVESEIWAEVSPTPSQPIHCQECGDPLGDHRFTLKGNNQVITCSALCAVAYFYLGEKA